MTMRKRTAVIIQARMGSTRFPGKVLTPLADKTALHQLIYRVAQAKTVKDIIVATSVYDINKSLVLYCRDVLGCKVIRGPEDDVLERVTLAARACRARLVIDITGDCPLVDPAQIDYLVNMIEDGYDYVSNCFPRSWPDGFDIQVYRYELLEEINRTVKNPIHRMHSGWNILNYRKDLEHIKVGHLPAPRGYKFPEWGLTLDTYEDAILIDIIFKHFKREGKKNFNAIDIINYIKANKGLLEINKHIERKTPGEG